MTFKEHYQEELRKPKPSQVFISRIAEVTCKSVSTVQMWLCGRQVPDKLTVQVIARELGCSPDELFTNN